MNRSILRSFKSSFRSEKGVTLIEVVVVMAIIAILSVATLGIVISLFDSSIRTAKYLDQNTTIETMYGFLASRLSVTQVGQVGVADVSTNKINPLTLSGDQFMFQSGGGGANNNISGSLCYRVFYLEQPIEGSDVFTQGDAVWVATAPDCADIMPTRGPNQDPGSVSEADPVLDEDTPMGTPFVLAGKIKSTNSNYTVPGGPNQCGGANDTKSFSSPLQFFIFCNGALEPLTIDEQASTENPANPAYDLTNLAQIRGLQSVAYVDSGNAPKVPLRSYSQVFSLGQVQQSCAIQGGGDPIEVEIPQPEGWREVNISGEPPFQSSWVNTGGSYSTAAFYKDSLGRVYLKGTVTRASAGAVGTTIFQLPVGYRPSQTLVFAAGGTGTKVDVNSNGDVVFQAGTGANPADQVSLASISFRAS